MKGILDFFKSPKKNPIPQKYYDYSIFKDKDKQDFFIRNGYCKLKMYTDEEMEEINQSFKELEPKFIEYFKEKFVNTGFIKDEYVRKRQNEIIKEFVSKTIPREINTKLAVVEPGVFLLKRPGEAGLLKPHQDGSLVDESKYYSLYVWSPMVETNETNGTVCVLPGSHLYGNDHRSVAVPWVMEEYEQQMMEYMVPINLKLGEVLIFDGSLIHYSPPNLSDKTRVAFSSVVLPKNYELIHYFNDKDTPEGKLEAYAVNEDFWLNYDIMKRPPEKFKFLKYIDKPNYSFTKRALDKFIKVHLP